MPFLLCLRFGHRRRPNIIAALDDTFRPVAFVQAGRYGQTPSDGPVNSMQWR